MFQAMTLRSLEILHFINLKNKMLCFHRRRKSPNFSPKKLKMKIEKRHSNLIKIYNILSLFIESEGHCIWFNLIEEK